MAAQLTTKILNKTLPLPVGGGNLDWQTQSTQDASRMKQILDGYLPIALEGMDRVKLLNRIDTKYVIHVDQLAQALKTLSTRYRVLEISQHRLHAYRNLYYDTPEFDLFAQHHRGMRDRYKVRCREYVDTGLTYMEVKRKNNRNRTIKSRLQIPEFIDLLPLDRSDFLREYFPFDPQSLNPVLWNDFHRITLVSKFAIERLTLDINLGFSDGWNRFGLPGVAVVEVKQDGFSSLSDFMIHMRSLGVQPQRFSKYCMGISIFNPEIKANNFKPRTLLVERIMWKGVQNGYLH